MAANAAVWVAPAVKLMAAGQEGWTVIAFGSDWQVSGREFRIETSGTESIRALHNARESLFSLGAELVATLDSAEPRSADAPCHRHPLQ